MRTVVVARLEELALVAVVAPADGARKGEDAGEEGEGGDESD